MDETAEFETKLRVQLEDRLRFETFISDLSARFVRIPSSKVHQEIERALREVTEFFHAHRCGLLKVIECASEPQFLEFRFISARRGLDYIESARSGASVD